MNIIYSLQGPNQNQNNRINGVTVGLVTNINDPEDMGRIKVKFLIRESPQESDWIRIASPMAGAGKGLFFLPEVGDEVLLAFHYGNVDEPFVIGMLWNNKDKPPVANAYANGKVNIRTIKTSSGNEIIFTDEKGKEKVEIHTAKGRNIVLDDEQAKIEIKDDKSKNTIIIDSSANGITLEAAKMVTIKVQSSKIEVSSSGGISLETSTGAVKIKANQIQLEATSTMDIKANAALNLKAGGITKIEGAMVQIN
ncbi:MAG: phage baseplate assembly protein V [Syntrophomonas sp.]|nr:phage baseplate assembly protein V [Syntrophomonas sp.]